MKIRRKLLIASVLSLLIFNACRHETETLLERLQELPGVTVSEIAAPAGYLQAFQIDLVQLLDHRNAQGKKFSQRIFLSHLGEDKPMVLRHSGYGVGRNTIGELATLLGANQVYVTHRYFPGARSDPVDWQYLDIWQAAADHHAIVSLLKEIYKGKWISTGASKGGMTALFDRRFYPDDVTATVAYVAPIMFGTEDPRFKKFLFEQVSTPEARDKIQDFQRLLLANLPALLPYAEEYLTTTGYHMSIGLSAALEYAIVEYLFAFWQYGDGDAGKIPAADASAKTWFDHLTAVSGLYYYTDEGIAYSEPFFYQAYTQLGYTPYFYDHLQYLLTAVQNPDYRSFAPKNTVMNFDPFAMQDVHAWLQNYGSNIIYIYGGNDPYTAAAVELADKTNALKIVQPSANHSVKIANLDERDKVIQALEQWLGVDINAAVLATLPPEPREPFRLGFFDRHSRAPTSRR